MNELPWRCRSCSREQMVDMDHLESWPLDKLTTAQGFTCKNCGSREAISYSTASFMDAIKHLVQMSIKHRKYPYYFAKAVRKAEGINKRSKHGTRGNRNVVVS